MEFKERLAQNLLETLIFMATASFISVNIIAPIITGLTMGFSMSNWGMVLLRIPIIWISAILLLIFIRRPASKLAGRILDEKSNFKTSIFVTMIFNSINSSNINSSTNRKKRNEVITSLVDMIDKRAV
ncbi:hypothetical protein [Companilactobacillus ginsenosidimutans]|uniref:hypothetical protein n=1 Tax=Companilactobacillus ginsenosidimutans TaxID=1007676 RepID=UPI00069D24FB|nr:hypothetical protein [Companilactobacillus ginsenosidimutans]